MLQLAGVCVGGSMQGAVRATFRAISSNLASGVVVDGCYPFNAAPTLAPVGASRLAQRRGRNQPKSSTEV